MKQRRLTLKQKMFVDEYIKTKNATKAAMKIYDTKSKTMAAVIGSENIRKHNVAQRIEQVLRDAKYEPVASVRSIMSIEEKGNKRPETYSASLKASEMLLKMSSLLIEKSQHVSLSANIDNMAPTDLLILKKKYDKLLEK